MVLKEFNFWMASFQVMSDNVSFRFTAVQLPPKWTSLNCLAICPDKFMINMSSEHLIVYADDDLDDIGMFQDYFDNLGKIKILPASDGLDALQILNRLKQEKIKPCLVILDINMPLLNGKDTLLKIKS